MSAVTYQQVLDATKFIELHAFQGTSVVVCGLTVVDGRFILGIGMNKDGEDFDVTRNGVRAREAANLELAKQLEASPLEMPEPAAAEAAPQTP